ncbi:cyclic pyranopterin monophosphate synthase MoaC [Candidatus Hecatella orcuttiae]|jgi:cyclic pyranopterin phosphate synthase|uniref:cyclic pyranopterin monophosphate synthase MoaC n=1 Tax=Candidatus Hecatella orcuttiae TaxID=1935119 RepID=UPI002867DFD5|nr:cyclic pyranopterin monophosphate synthase MoaC [Candidatus Hecatella orcuttiae]
MKKTSMVDVTPKPVVFREASAEGLLRLRPSTVRRIRRGEVEKGDPLEVARLAGILAAKNTSQFVALCHPLPLTHVDVAVDIADGRTVRVVSTVRAEAKTGVEMEALVAAATALLNVWDMVKKYEKDRGGQYPTAEILSLRVKKKFKGEP